MKKVLDNINNTRSCTYVLPQSLASVFKQFKQIQEIVKLTKRLFKSNRNKEKALFI